MRFVVCLLLLCSVIAQAADSPWAKVSALTAGETVRVQTATAKHEGTLASVSDEAIVIIPAAGDRVAVSRADVQRVYVRGRSHRMRNTIIGTAIGVGVGIAIYGTLGAWFRNEGVESTEYMLVTPLAIGAGVGAALPKGGMRKIYDARH